VSNGSANILHMHAILEALLGITNRVVDLTLPTQRKYSIFNDLEMISCTSRFK
jgi:hypothetical protein